jgi:hypothetical protein
MSANILSKLPEAEAILAGDIEPNLPNRAREVLLDVILAWANLDMVTAFFVAAVSELDPDEGAQKFGKKEIAEKLKRAVTVLQASGKVELAANLQEIADVYPGRALLRRRIAHTKCAGVRKSDPNCIVFLPFEKEGPPKHLAVEVFHLSAFVEAIEWATKVHNLLLSYVDQVKFFDKQ